MIPKTTNLTQFSAVYLVILLILVMSLKRDLVLLPFFLVALYMTIGQLIVIAGFNMTILRITLFFTWVRILIRGEQRRFRPGVLDRWLVCWLSVRTVANLVLWRAAPSAVVANLGNIYDTAGIYFLFRIMIVDHEDLRRAVIVVCALAVPLSAMMFVESFTGHNLFAVFGGVPETAVIREGRPRSQGPFRHPILAGTFGAAMIPFAVSLVRDLDPRVRRTGFAAILACLAIVLLSVSSGPLMATLAVFMAMLLWPLRGQMRPVRWALVLGLATLQMFMKAPIWYLSARITDRLGMGGGWYRSALIDAAVRHFGEWALVGTAYTAHWMPFQLSSNPNMVDITNQYIGEGVDGGVITMAFFIALLVAAYRHVGAGRSFAQAAELPQREFAAWAVGATLTAHAVSFLSVGYFDQMVVFWFLSLAAAAVVGAVRTGVSLAPAEQPSIVPG